MPRCPDCPLCQHLLRRIPGTISEPSVSAKRKYRSGTGKLSGSNRLTGMNNRLTRLASFVFLKPILTHCPVALPSVFINLLIHNAATVPPT